MSAILSAPEPSSPVGDDALVWRTRSGDASAFELLMRRHNRRLYRLARGIVRNAADAEEVVQDAYVQAFERIESYRGPNGFAAWLGRIVLNRATDRARERGRVVSLDAHLSESGERPHGLGPEQLASRSPDPERLAVSGDLRRLIEAAVDALPEEFRTVFMLRAVEGLSVEETAHQLDVPPATVRTRYHRARERVRSHLGDSLEEMLPAAFPFAGERCDRIVAAVLDRTTAGLRPSDMA
jgi:RNA polymerase sigma-70 factor, ECF subfamily